MHKSATFMINSLWMCIETMNCANAASYKMHLHRPKQRYTREQGSYACGTLTHCLYFSMKKVTDSHICRFSWALWEAQGSSCRAHRTRIEKRQSPKDIVTRIPALWRMFIGHTTDIRTLVTPESLVSILLSLRLAGLIDYLGSFTHPSLQCSISTNIRPNTFWNLYCQETKLITFRD